MVPLYTLEAVRHDTAIQLLLAVAMPFHEWKLVRSCQPEALINAGYVERYGLVKNVQSSYLGEFQSSLSIFDPRASL